MILAKKQTQTKLNFLIFVIGIFILALGVALTIISKLGTSPFDALLVGLSKEIGLTVGSWEIILAFILIFCNAVLTRSKPLLLGMVTAIITGIGIDLWLFTLGHFIQPVSLLNQFICFIAGIVTIALGTAIYLYTKFAPIPVDGLMLIIRDITGRSILFSRTLISVVFLLLAYMFNGPIGIGTLLTVCFVGPILNYIMPLTDKMLGQLFLKKSNTAASS